MSAMSRSIDRWSVGPPLRPTTPSSVSTSYFSAAVTRLAARVAVICGRLFLPDLRPVLLDAEAGHLAQPFQR
jgi:hypothetical protein